MGNGTELGRVRGLGAAHQGAHHWLTQRFTAIGNLVLVLFLAASFLMLPDLSYDTVRGWIGGAIPATLIALLIISTFWHARLGLQVLVEDYVHEGGSKFALIVLMNLAFVGGGAFGLLSLVRLALGTA